eukprot:COSAG03_NODE_9397_length_723_cov_0.883013_1_plen_62_part_01
MLGQASFAMTDANYMRNSARVKAEAAAEGGMAFDGRPYDMVDWESQRERESERESQRGELTS